MSTPASIGINLLLIVIFLGVAAYCDHRWRRRPTHIDGWWHQQESAGQQWMPSAWYDACQMSLQRSHERRAHADDR